MKTKLTVPLIRPAAILLLLLSTLNLRLSPLFAQGSLTPPGAPAPTMKTLDQIEPRTPIPGGTSSNNYSISQPGSYYLTGSRTILGDSTAAIYISASNVTLDLNGYSLISTQRLPANTTGISAHFGTARSNVRIRNGQVVGFQIGVLSSANHTVIENLTVTDTRMRGINIIGDGTARFVTVIRNNIVLNTDLNQSGSANNDGTGILTQGAANGVIEGNVVSGAFGLAPPSTLDGIGIYVEAATHMLVVGNRISNATQGIFFNGPGSYRDNVTMAVTTPYTGGTNLGNNQ